MASEPAAQTQHGEAAFFDVDNTLMKGASLFHVARKLHQRGAFTLAQAAGFAWKQLMFILRGENIDDVHAVRDSALKLAAGITAKDIEALGEEVYDEMIDSRIWPGAKALGRTAPAGRAAASGSSPRPPLKWLPSFHPAGPDRRAGHGGRDPDGSYTGRLVGDILARPGQSGGGAGNSPTTKTWTLALLGLQRLLQRHPAAVLVGHPVAINPDSKLRRYSREHNWPVYDFRAAGAPQPWDSRPPLSAGPSTACGGASPASAAPAAKPQVAAPRRAAPGHNRRRTACRNGQEKCPPPGRQRANSAVRSIATSYCGAGDASCEAACGASSWPYACDAS